MTIRAGVKGTIKFQCIEKQRSSLAELIDIQDFEKKNVKSWGGKSATPVYDIWWCSFKTPAPEMVLEDTCTVMYMVDYTLSHAENGCGP